ncbi:MAG: NAD(P)/FAD-dependent oxidoreductase [Desulfosarcinaceae bacterium]
MAQEKPEKFDLCVIGCGPGGFAGAMRALDAGKHVCLIEADEVGGAGVKWGALSSKTMWELAKDFAIAKREDRGYRVGLMEINYSELRATVLEAVKEKQYQMLSQLETFSPACWSGPGSITYKIGVAEFLSAHEVGINHADGSQEVVTADHFLIATGSAPRDLPDIPCDHRRILNSDSILALTDFPRRMMIIGAGITGCEYATIFSNFKQTQVTLVVNRERVLPYEDTDVSAFVEANLAENGVAIIHSARLKTIYQKPDHLEVVLTYTDGHAQVIEVDTVLVSIGRIPRLSRLRLERAGIEADQYGYLNCDENGCVKDHIYAAGDVTHRPALVNMAVMESRDAVKHMFDIKRWPLTYHNLSTVMFFYPAVAAVGLSEKECQERGIAYRVASYDNALVPRAIAMRATRGFIKILVSDDEELKLLGMRAGGPQVSNTIMSITLLMDQDKGTRDVLKSMYPHPTMSEGFQECLRLLLGKSIYKPQAFPEWLSVRRWHPEKGYLAVDSSSRQLDHS